MYTVLILWSRAVPPQVFWMHLILGFAQLPNYIQSKTCEKWEKARYDVTQYIAICIWKDSIVDFEHVHPKCSFNVFLALRMKHWTQRWIFGVILLNFYYIWITSLYLHFSLFGKKAVVFPKAELAQQLCSTMYYVHIGSIRKHLIMQILLPDQL